MLQVLVLAMAAASVAVAQDMSAEVTDAPSETDLLAYTTITTACQPAVDPNNEPIFSIQTDTNVESCTYVVNADNTAQVVSTIGSAPTAAPEDTDSGDLPVSTGMGTFTESVDQTITDSSSLPTDSSDMTTDSSAPEATTDSSTPDTTTPETTDSGSEEPTATSEPVETPTDDAAGRVAMGGEVLGVVGLMAALVAL